MINVTKNWLTDGLLRYIYRPFFDEKRHIFRINNFHSPIIRSREPSGDMRIVIQIFIMMKDWETLNLSEVIGGDIGVCWSRGLGFGQEGRSLGDD